MSLIHRHRNGIPPDPDAAPLDAVAGLPEQTRELLRWFKLRESAQAIVDAVGLLNQHLEATAPWKLAKDPNAARELDAVVSQQLATAQVIADALAPITPSLAQRARRQLTAQPRLPALEPLIQRLETRGLAPDHAQFAEA